MSLAYSNGNCNIMNNVFSAYRTWNALFCLGDIVIGLAMAIYDPHPQVCATLAIKKRLAFTCVVGTRGTFVTITMPGKKRTLILCQVEIYGHPGTYWRTITNYIICAWFCQKLPSYTEMSE